MFNEEDGQGGFQKVKTEATAVNDNKTALGLISEIRSVVNANSAAGLEGQAALKADVDRTRGLLDSLQEEIASLKAHAARPVAPEPTDRHLKGFITTRHLEIEKQGRVAPGDAVLRGYHDKDHGIFVPGLLDQTTVTDHPWLRELRKAIGDLHIVCTVKGWNPGRYAPKTCKRIGLLLQKAPKVLADTPAFRALTKAFVDSAGVGAEWIIDLGIPDLIDNSGGLFNGPVASLFASVPMQGQTVVLPAMTQSLRAYKYTATSSDDPAEFTSSSITTAQRTYSAVGMAVMSKLDRDAEEDAIIAAAPGVRRQMLRILALCKDDCIINGDSDGTHIHTGLASFSPKNIWGSSNLGGSDDHRTCWDGLIKQALTNNSGSGAADLNSSQTYDGMQAMLAKGTGELGMPGSSTATILGRSIFFKVLRFDEYKTAEKVVNLGSNESAGSDLMLFGFPVVVTDFMSDELNTSGIYDGTTTDNTGFLTLDTSRFRMRDRLGNVIETDIDIAKNQRRLVGRYRGLFAPEASVAAGDNHVDVVYGYNIDS